MAEKIVARAKEGSLFSRDTEEGNTSRRVFAQQNKMRISSNASLFDRAGAFLERADNLGDDSWRACVDRFVRSRLFEWFVNFLICTSAMQMGYQVQHGHGPMQQIFEAGFSTVFFGEMCLKAYAYRWHYFRSLWNWMDCLVTWSSVLYASIQYVDMTGTFIAEYTGSGRTLRLLRLFRILKIMRSVPQLRTVLDSLIGSLQALFWVLVMLLLVWYTFSVFFVDIVGKADVYPGFNDAKGDVRASLRLQNFNNFEYFGTLDRSMMTLFGLTMLSEWEAMRPIFEFQHWLIAPMVLLIFVTSFGIVNIIIGVIVERTTLAMASSSVVKRQKERQKLMEKIRVMATLIWELDQNGNGLISLEEMRGITDHPAALAHFQDLGLPKGFTFDEMFEMLNLSGREELCQDEFIDVMHRIVFMTDFHKNCFLLQGMGQAKKQGRDMQRQIFEQHHQYLEGKFAELLAEVRGEIAELKTGGSVFLDGKVKIDEKTKEQKFMQELTAPDQSQQNLAAACKRREDLLHALLCCEANLVSAAALPLPAPAPEPLATLGGDGDWGTRPGHSEPQRMGLGSPAPKLEVSEPLPDPGTASARRSEGFSSNCALCHEEVLKELLATRQQPRRGGELWGPRPMPLPTEGLKFFPMPKYLML